MERFYNIRDPEYLVTIRPDPMTAHLVIEMRYKFRQVMAQYRISRGALERAHDQCDLIEYAIKTCHMRIEREINRPLNGLQKMKMRLKNGIA